MNDYEWMKLAWEARGNSRCKKNLGTVLVSDCDNDVDVYAIGYNDMPFDMISCIAKFGKCPRSNSDSGKYLHLCPAIHAEVFPILEFAKRGVSTKGATLYCSFGVPCKDCMKEIISCGITRIVVTRRTYYDELSKSMLDVFVENGGILDVLNVVKCPNCNSLNANAIEMSECGLIINCPDCGHTYQKSQDAIYVGD